MDNHNWEFWVDRGGTFTDIIARDPTGHLVSHKLLSDSPHYSDATIQGIRDILQLGPQEHIPPNLIAAIKIGTTVATNALLERKGERLLLAITKGLEDALRIGYQNRPSLFDFNIKLPSVLYEDVIAIDERVDAHGNILKPLDVAGVTLSLEEGYKKGFRAIAIVLMHGYRYSDHEQQIARIAQKIGYKQISASHRVAPTVKLITRGETTVVDAYLSPLLIAYVQRLQTAFCNTPLFFMQGNGRLANAKTIQAKDSLLSGAAGGLIGMVKTSQAAGFHQIIGFDMGGTSTDVSHFAGEYERRFETEIGGVPLRIPMMLINTIAAGGGSILHFDGARYRVGPDSAAANPGPACYRQGGPLTITDCNVLLGKIQADFFPQVFGSKGNLPIDIKVVRKKFHLLSKEIERTTGKKRTVEQVAEGYLKIAIENMANAIKKISVQRGYDVTHYVLNCFGGAGGQHACLVADALGIGHILIHPFAGLLSAYGVGHGEIGLIREHSIGQRLTAKIKLFIKHLFATLSEEMTINVSKESADSKILFQYRVQIRYEGSDTSISVAFDTIKNMRKEFEKKHRNQFGFIAKQKKLIVESIFIEAIAATKVAIANQLGASKRPSGQKIPYRATIKLFSHDRFHHAKIYARADLKKEDYIEGPALISDVHATTVIELGWHAKVTSNENIVLSRHQPLQKQILQTDYDPVLLEIFNNRFMAIAEQMGEVLRSSASSVNIKERLDFSCAIFDNQGELVANAPHIPVHLGSMSESVKSLLQQRKKNIQPGDTYMSNSPYEGGTHLPDITIVSPVFDFQNELVFLVGSRGHHADIGGITPGSIPANSQVIDEEGVLITHVQIMARGRFFERAIYTLLTEVTYPARNPTQNISDLKAQVAANERGIHMLLNLCQQFSSEVVAAYMKHVRLNAKRATQRLLQTLNKGEFRYRLDDNSQIHVVISIDKENKRACVDFTGSASQHPGNFNAPRAVCQAAVLYVIRCLVNEDIPLNGGCLEPIDIILPTPSILNPSYPAAVVAGNVETSQCIVDTLLGAFKAVAASQGTCNNFTFGNEKYQYYETICGGAGAGSYFNGASAVHTHMTNTRLTDPEILELRFPVLLQEFAIREGSGGAGEYQGGNGVIRRIQFLASMTANIISNHRKVPPYGLFGGCSGKVGYNWVQRVDGNIVQLGSSAEVQMRPGDIFIIATPGGGGFGSPSRGAVDNSLGRDSRIVNSPYNQMAKNPMSPIPTNRAKKSIKFCCNRLTLNC
jgi:5-oxoprolinase (ATP-hydrolysing)